MQSVQLVQIGQIQLVPLKILDLGHVMWLGEHCSKMAFSLSRTAVADAIMQVSTEFSGGVSVMRILPGKSGECR